MGNDYLTAFREANREAGAILLRRNNRLKLIEGILLLATVWIFALLLREGCRQMATLVVKSAVWKLLLGCLGDLLFWGILLLVTAPMALGLLQMAARMANDEDVFLPDLFLPFSGKKAFFGALSVLFPFYWKLLAFFLLPNLLFELLNSTAGIFLPVLAGVILAVLFAVWLLLALFGFARLSFSVQWRMPLLASGRASRHIAKKSFSGGGLWWICYLPRILLGFLTVGILLVADVIPRMMISYFRYAGRMTDYDFSSEEPDHE